MTGRVWVLAMAALAVVAPASAAVPPVLGPMGAGRDQVWVIRAKGPARDVVVFGHGWKHSPSTGDGWIRQFGPWLEHLSARGSDIVFPRYQVGGEASPSAGLAGAFRAGSTTGLDRLRARRLPTVVVGYSFGASLAFSYTANATRWGLPAPAAVMGIFPAAPVVGVPLPRLRGPVRARILVGDRDDVAGHSGADAFWAWLGNLPPAQRRYQVVHSHGGFAATHAAPKLSSHAAQRAFWRPLDGTIAAVRRGAAEGSGAPGT